MIKRSWRRYLVLSVFVGAVFVAGQHMDFIMGTAWHIANSRVVEYGSVRITVPWGWFPVTLEEGLALNRYPRDGAVILFTTETRELPDDPRELVESAGRIFDSAEKVMIQGNEGLRVTSHVESDARPYLVFITLPGKNLTVTYHGSREGIAALDSILEHLGFL